MGREIVIGVSGGIAAYKSAALVSLLVQRDLGVTVVMTRAARKFVGAATFQALTGRRVVHRLFDADDYHLGAHIHLADQAELLCVAPATADVMAKAAHGVADDALSTLLLSFTGDVLFAPAMNTQMWEKAAVQRNVEQLRQDGCHFVGPAAGWLSCRQQSLGRMSEPDEIAAAIERILGDESRETRGATSDT